MTKKPSKEPPLTSGLATAMRALDKQIARSMQRSPAEREQMGVQKWEPLNTKVEEVTTAVLELIGEDIASIDALLVLARAFPKALKLLVEELGEDGLGSLRSAYCRDAAEQIERDCRDLIDIFRRERTVN